MSFAFPTFSQASQRETEDGSFRLRKAEDSVLLLFWQEFAANHASLEKEGHVATKAGITKFHRCYDETAPIACAPGSGQKSKMIAEAKQIFEEQMVRNDETMGKELQELLGEKGINYSAQVANPARLDFQIDELLSNDT